MPRLTLLSFLLHPSFFRIAVAIGLEHLRIVFSIPRQLERVTGCLAIRSAGETQMVQFSCHPVCLAETSGSKWRRIYSNTHIHTHTDEHTSSIKCIHSHAYVCVESFRTHFFNLYWRLLLDTLVQRHLNGVQR